MKRNREPLSPYFLAVLILTSCSEPAESPFLPGAHGEYLVEPPPAGEMALFAPGLITFGTHEHHLTFTPDGEEMFYVIADMRRRHHTIIQVRRQGDDWLRPKVAPFSGAYNDFAPTPAPDGNSLLFCSSRPLPGAGPEPADVNIWKMDRIEGGWGEPYPLPGDVNDESGEYNPTLALDGTLYFQDHDGTSVEIYRARLVDGAYEAPEKVEEVSTPYPEIAPLVTPDGSTLIFSSGRPGGEGELDFWATFKGEEETWSEPVNLGSSINTPASDAIITFSPDGEFFFFTNFMAVAPDRIRNRPYEELVELLGGPENGDGTIYWISTDVMDNARRSR